MRPKQKINEKETKMKTDDHEHILKNGKLKNTNVLNTVQHNVK